jgi:hypothetical protein
MRAISHNR